MTQLTYEPNSMLQTAQRDDGQVTTYGYDKAYRQTSYALLPGSPLIPLQPRNLNSLVSSALAQAASVASGLFFSCLPCFPCLPRRTARFADSLGLSTTRQTYVYDINGRTLSESKTEDDQTQTTTFTQYDDADFPMAQTSDYQKQFHDDLTTALVRFDEPKISKVLGIRHWDDGDKDTATQSLYATYNANGLIASVEGAVDTGFRAFVTNQDNRIVFKQAGPDQREYYFYLNQSPIGTYGDIPPDGIQVGNPPKYVNFNLNFVALPPNAGSGVFNYTIHPGDTWASMAQQFFGDSHLADKVAACVNLTANDPVPIGMSITIKSLFAFQNKNWYGVYATYDESTIIGGYYPDIPVPYHRPPKQHHSVFDEILETAVFVAVMVVTTILTDGAGSYFVAAMWGALGGAAASIAEQETARALHDQKGFNWNQVGINAVEGAIAGGIGAWLQGAKFLSSSKFLMNLEAGEIAALSSEGIEYAVGITSHFKWSDVVATAASAAVQSGTQYAFGDVSTRSFTQSLFASAFNAVGSAMIGRAVYGEDIDVGMVVADSLGTAVGEYVGTKVTETKIAQDAKTKLDKKLSDWFPQKKQAQPSIRSTSGSQLPRTAANDDSYGVCAWNGQDPLSDSSDSSQGQSSSDSQSQSPTSKRASQSQSTQSKADQWNAGRSKSWTDKGNNPNVAPPGIIPEFWKSAGSSDLPDYCQQLYGDPETEMSEAQFLMCEDGVKMTEILVLDSSVFKSGFFGGSLEDEEILELVHNSSEAESKKFNENR